MVVLFLLILFLEISLNCFIDLIRDGTFSRRGENEQVVDNQHLQTLSQTQHNIGKI
jgi:hypothetical protein